MDIHTPTTKPAPGAVQAALNATLRDNLPIIAFCIALIYFALGPSHLVMLEPQESRIMTPLALTGGVLLCGLGLVLYRRKVPPAWAHPLAMIVVLVATANSTAHLILTGDLVQSTNFVLLLIGIGCVSLSVPWTVLALTIVGGAWLVATWRFEMSGPWDHYLVMLAISLTIALLVFALRFDTRRRLEILRWQDTLQRDELDWLDRVNRQINRVQSQFIRHASQAELFESVVDGLVTLCESDCGFVAECDSIEGKEFTILAKHGLASAEAFDQVHMSFDDSLLSEGQTISSDTPLAGLLGFTTPGLRTGARHSWLAPLKLGGLRIGLLGVERGAIAYPEGLYHRLEPYLITCANIIAANQSERRRTAAEAALRESEERFRNVTEAAGEYVWEVDSSGRFVFMTRRVKDATGFPPESFIGKTPFEIMYPDDAERFRKVVAESSGTNLSFTGFEFRMRNADGNEIWQSISGLPFVSEDGSNHGYRGVGSDITRRKLAARALHESEERFHLAVRGTNDGIWDWRIDTGYVFYSDRAREFLGFGDNNAELPAQVLEERVVPEDLPLVQQAMQAHFEKRVPLDVECRVRTANGQQRWARIRGQAIWDEQGKPVRVAGSVSDITDRKQAERDMAEMSEQLAISTQNLKQLHRLTCHPFADPAEVFADYLSTGCRIFGFGTGILSRIRGDMYEIEAILSDIEGLHGAMSFPLSDAYCSEVAAERRTVSFRSASRTMTYPESCLFRRLGIEAYIGTPITVNGLTYGTLCFLSKSTRLALFRSHETEFIELMAQSLARVIEAREIERVRREAEAAIAQAREYELEIGARIQETLLQGLVPEDLRGAQIAAMTTPSEGIDGDFYDFYTHGPHCFDLTLGDVMGKGVPAALVSAATKGHVQRALSDLLARESHESLPPPRDVVALVHERVAERLIELESFITFCYARFDMERRRLNLVDCGHTRTIHVHGKTGEYELIKGENLPLGFSIDEAYVEVVRPIEDGDVLFFYSDGVTEACNSAGELFGMERLIATVCRARRLPPEQILARVRKAVQDFAGTVTMRDDLTCITIAVGPPRSNEALLRSAIEVSSSLTELCVVRDFVRDSCERAFKPALAPEVIESLELAAQEATSNIMRHAYDGSAGKPIRVTVEARFSDVRITFEHEGKHFNPGSVPEPIFDGTQEGGFGLYIIRNLMDEVSFQPRERGGCVMSMVKYLHLDPHEQELEWTSKPQK